MLARLPQIILYSLLVYDIDSTAPYNSHTHMYVYTKSSGAIINRLTLRRTLRFEILLATVFRCPDGRLWGSLEQTAGRTFAVVHVY